MDPPTNKELADNSRELDKLHVSNRFRLMFGQPLLTDTDTMSQETIRTMQIAAERRNRELDALHYVWCDGGCDGGTHRWQTTPLTEELVVTAERNTARLRRWWNNRQFRDRWNSMTPSEREAWMAEQQHRA